MDLRGLPDDMLDSAVAHLDSGRPTSVSPEEQAALRAEQARRRAAKAPPVDNVEDNLQASATPLTADPGLRGKPADLGPPPTKWQELMDDPRNFNVSEADRIAATSDPGIQSIMERLPNRYERFGRDMNALDARMRWERGQPDGTPPYPDLASPRGTAQPVGGTPYAEVDGLMVPGQMNALGEVEVSIGAENRAREARDQEFQDAGGEYGVPGPRMDDGTGAAPPRRFASPEEARRYWTRPTDPRTGRLMPSQADLDMQARGETPVYAPEGHITYRHTAPNAPGILPPGGPESGPYHNRYAQHLLDTGNYEVRQVDGPFGTQRVLVPSQASRDRMRRRQQEDAADRVAERTGLDPAQLMDPEARGRASRRAYAAEVASRRNRVRSMAMLAGGSNNINSDNRWMFNALLELPPDERQAALRQMLPMNPVRAQVEARQLDSAARLAQQAVTGALALQGQPNPLAIRETQRMDDLRAKAGQAANSVWNKDYSYEAAEEVLINEGATREQRRAILEDLFGPGAGDGKPTAGAPADDSPSQGQYFPGQGPSTPPRNPLAAPRPFG